MYTLADNGNGTSTLSGAVERPAAAPGWIAFGLAACDGCGMAKGSALIARTDAASPTGAPPPNRRAGRQWSCMGTSVLAATRVAVTAPHPVCPPPPPLAAAPPPRARRRAMPLHRAPPGGGRAGASVARYYLGGYRLSQVAPGGNLTVLAASAAQSGGRLQAAFRLLLPGSAAALLAAPPPVLAAAGALGATGGLQRHAADEARSRPRDVLSCYRLCELRCRPGALQAMALCRLCMRRAAARGGPEPGGARRLMAACGARAGAGLYARAGQRAGQCARAGPRAGGRSRAGGGARRGAGARARGAAERAGGRRRRAAGRGGGRAAGCAAGRAARAGLRGGVWARRRRADALCGLPGADKRRERAVAVLVAGAGAPGAPPRRAWSHCAQLQSVALTGPGCGTPPMRRRLTSAAPDPAAQAGLRGDAGPGLATGRKA